MGLVAGPALSLDEEALLGHYRRLKKHHRQAKLEVFIGFKAHRRVIEIRPAPYIHVEVDQLESVFDAID